MISVIVPVYNAEKTIHHCVDSILSQTYSDFEVLLVDDGSKDGSGAICDEYAASDKRVRVLHKANGGVSSARNSGIEEAKGEWITFVDSDDWLPADSLSAMGSLESDLVIGGFVQTTKPTGRPTLYDPGKGVVGISTDPIRFGELLFTYMSTPWGKLFKRKIINDNGLRFRSDLFYGEDTDFVLRYAGCIDAVGCVSGSVYNYCYVDNVEGKYLLNDRDLKQLIDCTCDNFALLSQKAGYSYNSTRDILLRHYCSLYFVWLLKIHAYSDFLNASRAYRNLNCRFFPDSFKKRIFIGMFCLCPGVLHTCLAMRRKMLG